VGQTWQIYREKGPAGLAGGKREVIASSRDGSHSASETLQALDHQEIYLRTAPSFRRVIHVSVVCAGRPSISEERPARTSALAQAEIDRLAPRGGEEGTFSNPGATHEL
jgi:FMN-dependent NADH-azoreductase